MRCQNVSAIMPIIVNTSRSIKPRTRHLVLLGMSGVGKTTMARQVAVRTGWPCYDIDDLIEQRCQQTIPEIFASGGHDVFRAAESIVLGEVLQSTPGVIATGAGILTTPHNMSMLNAARPDRCYLYASPATLRCRLASSYARILTTPENIESMLRARNAAYRRCADFVRTDRKSERAVLKELLERYA